MAKQRHTEQDATSARGTLIVMTIGALLVAALVVWALTRTVEAPAPGVIDTPLAQTTSPAPLSTADTAAPSPPPASAGDPSSVARISAEDLREKMGRGEVTVVDVRDAASYEASHITGAMNIPFASVQGFVDMIPKDKEVVTYCT